MLKASSVQREIEAQKSVTLHKPSYRELGIMLADIGQNANQDL